LIEKPRESAKRRRAHDPSVIPEGETLKMAAEYEDNFGYWDVDGPEERAFFKLVQRRSVHAICERCEQPVRLIPPKTVCACCVRALECGAPASISDY